MTNTPQPNERERRRKTHTEFCYAVTVGHAHPYFALDYDVQFPGSAPRLFKTKFDAERFVERHNIVEARVVRVTVATTGPKKRKARP